MTRAGITAAQRAILAALSSGEHIAYSQDGECAWLMPSRVDLADSDVISLRALGFIENEIYDPDEHARFGPGDIISNAGRTALATPAAEGGE